MRRGEERRGEERTIRSISKQYAGKVQNDKSKESGPIALPTHNFHSATARCTQPAFVGMSEEEIEDARDHESPLGGAIRAVARSFRTVGKGYVSIA